MELLEQYYSDSRSKNELIRGSQSSDTSRGRGLPWKKIIRQSFGNAPFPWSNARSHILNQVPQHRPCNLQTILDTDPEMLVYHRP